MKRPEAITLKFHECIPCSLKPGMAEFCPACLAEREVVLRFNLLLEEVAGFCTRNTGFTDDVKPIVLTYERLEVAVNTLEKVQGK